MAHGPFLICKASDELVEASPHPSSSSSFHFPGPLGLHWSHDEPPRSSLKVSRLETSFPSVPLNSFWPGHLAPSAWALGTTTCIPSSLPRSPSWEKRLLYSLPR